MNILVIDAQGRLSEKQKRRAKNRLYFSLLRFGHRINGATMHLTFDVVSKQFKCAINVNVEGTGIVSVQKNNVSPEAVVNLAVNAVEPKVAFCVDWQAWFNADTFATWLNTFAHPWNEWFGVGKNTMALGGVALTGQNRKSFNRRRYWSDGGNSRTS